MKYREKKISIVRSETIGRTANRHPWHTFRLFVFYMQIMNVNNLVDATKAFCTNFLNIIIITHVFSYVCVFVP